MFLIFIDSFQSMKDCVKEERRKEENDHEKLLKNFINFIKTYKVVVLEDLAVSFKVKTQAAIVRI